MDPQAARLVLTYDTRDIEQMMEILAIAAGYNTTRSQKKWDYVMLEQEVEDRLRVGTEGPAEIN